MILEGLVTTLDAAGGPHVAPMGPHVEGPAFDRFALRPFPTAQTYRNLLAHGEGVLHVTDDVLLLAKAAGGAGGHAAGWGAARVGPRLGLGRLLPVLRVPGDGGGRVAAAGAGRGGGRPGR